MSGRRTRRPRHPLRSPRGPRRASALAIAASLLASLAAQSPARGGSPVVVGTSPADGAMGVDISASITVTFDVPMDQATTEPAITVSSDAGAVAGSASLAGDTLTFTPSADLACETPHTVTIAGTAEDALGNPLGADYVFTFTTRPWLGFAVLVGVSDYPGEDDDLPAPTYDAGHLRETLLLDAEHWSDANVTVLLDSAAARAAIQTSLDARFGQARPADVCLLFFSGHGTVVPDTNDNDEAPVDTLDEAILPHDFGTGGYILDDDLADWLAPHAAKRICIILDSCRAGGMAKLVGPSTSESWTDGFASDVLSLVAARRPVAKDISETGQAGIVMLMASSEEGYAYEDPVLRHAVFTFYIIEALRRDAADADGDGLVSAEEAFAYAAPRATSWIPSQVPELYDSYSAADPGEELPLMAAGDRPLESIVTLDDLPFGDTGCAPGPAGARAGGAPVSALAALALLVLVRPRGRSRSGRRAGAPSARVEAARARRRRREAAPVHVCLVCLLCGPAPVGCSLFAGAESPPRLGARTGIVVPFCEKNAEYPAAGQVGVFAGATLGDRPFRLELGGDYMMIEGDDLDVKAHLFVARADAVSLREGLPDGAQEPFAGYFALGPRFLVADARTYWGGGFQTTMGLGGAAGLRSPGRGWDARVSLDLLPLSGNIRALFGASAGWTF